jgi:Endosomal/lysosomal potassium channel TMEM175
VSTPPRYSVFAGRSLGRLAGLSDGVFAVAMTLLVLDLKVPSAGGVESEGDLGHLLVALGPRVLTYLLSFTLGIFWIGQQTHPGLPGRLRRRRRPVRDRRLRQHPRAGAAAAALGRRAAPSPVEAPGPRLGLRTFSAFPARSSRRTRLGARSGA